MFEEWKKSREAQKILNFLRPGTEALDKIKKLDERDLERLTESPYAACRLIGWDIAKVDREYAFYGYNCDADYHKQAYYVDRCVNTYLCSSGSMGMNCDDLLEAVQEKFQENGLSVSETKVKRLLNTMIVRGDYMMFDQGAIFTREDNELEEYVSDKIVALTTQKMEPVLTEEILERCEKEVGITLAQKQKEAILETNNHAITMIVGGPGTGKTTLQKTLIRAYQEAAPDMRIMLIAPTGRASSRMAEASGQEAFTAHAALGISEKDTAAQDHCSLIAKVEEKAAVLSADLILVDEVSMVDMPLMAYLMSAVLPGARIIFFGDDGQLPSVGKGAVCRELVRMGKKRCIGFCRLEVLFRQKEDSSIATLANAIRKGQMDDYPLEGDVTYIPEIETENLHERRGDIKEKVLDAIKTEMAKGIPMNEIIVLTPIKRVSEMGANSLNLWLQDQLIPSGKELCYENRKIKEKKVFRVGSRVMQNKNTTQAKNGELGTVVEVHENYLMVQFDEHGDSLIQYSMKDLDRLELAFVITIHKSQGSQFKSVILPLEESYRKMGNRELYTTAVSRAGKKLYLIGDLSILQTSANKVGGVRISRLASRVVKKVRIMRKSQEEAA